MIHGMLPGCLAAVDGLPPLSEEEVQCCVVLALSLPRIEAEWGGDERWAMVTAAEREKVRRQAGPD